MKSKTNHRVLTALLTALYFLQSSALSVQAEVSFWKERQQTLLAQAPMPSLAPLKPLSSLNIPRLPPGLRLPPYGPVVIHLMDVHGHEEAQRNLSELVSSYDNKSPILALEAAFGPMDLSAYQNYPNRRTLQIAADYALKKGQISGPLHARLISRQPVPVMGVDDRDLHAANVRAYKNSLHILKDARKQIDQQRSLLNRKPNGVSDNLYQFEKFVDRAFNKEISFGEFALGLADNDSNLPLALKQYLVALDSEKTLNSPAIERERSSILQKLSDRMTPGELGWLFEESLLLRSGIRAHGDFYESFTRLCRTHDVDLEKYPHFSGYVRYVTLASSLNGEEILQAAASQTKHIESQLSRSAADRRYVSQLKNVRASQRLITFSLTPDEWQEYKKFGLGTNPLLASFESFYLIAERRDSTMARELTALAKTAKNKPVLFVAGGFHAEGIKKHLNEANITVLRVDPRITQIENETGLETLSVFSREKTPLETIVHGESLFLAPLVGADAPQMAYHAVAAEALNGNLNAQTVYDGFPAAEPHVSVSAFREGSKVEETVAGPNGVANVNYQVSSDGGLLSDTTVAASVGPAAGVLFKTLLSVFNRISPELIVMSSVLLQGSPLFSWHVLISVAAVRSFIMAARLLHSLGHAVLISWVDRDIRPSEFLKNFLENMPFAQVLKTLVPLQWMPILSSRLEETTPRIEGNRPPLQTRITAAGGPLLNLAGVLTAILVAPTVQNPVIASVWALFAGANLFFLIFSFSDYWALATGRAAFLGCGILFISSPRLAEDEEKELLPLRHRTMLKSLSLDMAGFGPHGIGAALAVEDRVSGDIDYIDHKIPAGAGQSSFTYRRGGAKLLIRTFYDQFFPKINNVDKKRYSTGENIELDGHVRLKTSPGALTVDTTQPFKILSKRRVSFWPSSARHPISSLYQAWGAANGDLYDAVLPQSNFLDKSSTESDDIFYSEKEWGEFFSKITGNSLGENDSEKAAYFLYFLTTKGLWEASLRLSYVMHFMSSLSDPIPSPDEITAWSRTIEPIYQEYLQANTKIRTSGANPHDLGKAFLHKAVAALRNHDEFSIQKKSDEEVSHFVFKAWECFKRNDSLEAAKIFMTLVDGRNTFGLFFRHSLDPHRRVLICREQPVSFVFNEKLGSFYGGSSLDFVLDNARSDPAYRSTHVLKSISLKSNKDASGKGGEIARIDSKKKTVEIYSLSEKRMLTAAEVNARWTNKSRLPERMSAPMISKDNVGNDIQAVPLVGRVVREHWQAEKSTSRRSADAFLKSWGASALEFNRANERLLSAGHTTPVQHLAPDLFIVAFREENLNAAEFMQQLWKTAYPLAHIRVINSSEYIHEIGANPLFKNTHTLLLDPGINFSTIRAAEDLDRLFKRGSIGESAENLNTEIMKDQFSTEATWEILRRTYAREFPNVFLMTPREETNVSRSFDSGPKHVFNTLYWSPVAGSAGTLWAQVAAGWELFFHVSRGMRKNFPKGAPFGMVYTDKDINAMEEKYINSISQRSPEIVGMNFDEKRRPVPLPNAPAYESISQMADTLVPYFNEQARALRWNIIYLWTTILFTGTLMQALTYVVITHLGIPSGLPAFLVSLPFRVIDAATYTWFKYAIVRFLRWKEGREPMHRDHVPAVVFGDDLWHKFARFYLSSRFALAKAIISPPAIYSARQSYELEGRHAHDARRGTLAILSVPPNESESEFVKRAHAAASMTRKQVESFQSIGFTGPVVLGVMSEKYTDDLGFKRTVSIAEADDSYFRDPKRYSNPDQALKVVDMISSMDRLLATCVLAWKITQPLSQTKIGIPGTPFQYDLGWDYDDSPNSTAATTQIIPPPPTQFDEGRWYHERRELNAQSLEREEMTGPAVMWPQDSRYAKPVVFMESGQREITFTPHLPLPVSVQLSRDSAPILKVAFTRDSPLAIAHEKHSGIIRALKIPFHQQTGRFQIDDEDNGLVYLQMTGDGRVLLHLSAYHLIGLKGPDDKEIRHPNLRDVITLNLTDEQYELINLILSSWETKFGNVPSLFPYDDEDVESALAADTLVEGLPLASLAEKDFSFPKSDDPAGSVNGEPSSPSPAFQSGNDSSPARQPSRSRKGFWASLSKPLIYLISALLLAVAVSWPYQMIDQPVGPVNTPAVVQPATPVDDQLLPLPVIPSVEDAAPAVPETPAAVPMPEQPAQTIPATVQETPEKSPEVQEIERRLQEMSPQIEEAEETLRLALQKVEEANQSFQQAEEQLTIAAANLEQTQTQLAGEESRLSDKELRAALQQQELEALESERESKSEKVQNKAVEVSLETLAAEYAIEALELKITQAENTPRLSAQERTELVAQLQELVLQADSAQAQGAYWVKRSDGKAFGEALLKWGVAHRIMEGPGHTFQNPWIALTEDQVSSAVTGNDLASFDAAEVERLGFSVRRTSQEIEVVIPLAKGSKRGVVIQPTDSVLIRETPTGEIRFYRVIPGVLAVEKINASMQQQLDESHLPTKADITELKDQLLIAQALHDKLTTESTELEQELKALKHAGPSEVRLKAALSQTQSDISAVSDLIDSLTGFVAERNEDVQKAETNKREAWDHQQQVRNRHQQAEDQLEELKETKAALEQQLAPLVEPTAPEAPVESDEKPADENNDIGQNTEEKARLFSETIELLAKAPSGPETAATGKIINEVLQGSHLSMGVDTLGGTIKASHTRFDALKVIYNALKENPSLKTQVHERLGRPSLKKAKLIMQAAMWGADRSARPLASAADHSSSNRTLRMVALRSSLWKILSSGEQNDYLKALIGEHALGYRTTVVAVENESDQGLIQAKLNRLGREDVLLTVVPNLYTSKEQSIILEVGSLERGVLSRIPFEGYSLYEVIASPCEPNMKGVSTASALHHAMVRFINRAMEIVEEGSFAEIDLAIKTAALAALQS